MYEQELKNSDVVCFVDNEAVCSAYIKGSSSSSDVDHLASIAHLLACRSSIRVWYEWIDSNSNISDGLSRDGLQDAYAISQGWQLQEVDDIGTSLLNTPLTDYII